MITYYTRNDHLHRAEEWMLGAIKARSYGQAYFTRACLRTAAEAMQQAIKADRDQRRREAEAEAEGYRKAQLLAVAREHPEWDYVPYGYDGLTAWQLAHA